MVQDAQEMGREIEREQEMTKDVGIEKKRRVMVRGEKRRKKPFMLLVVQFHFGSKLWTSKSWSSPDIPTVRLPYSTLDQGLQTWGPWAAGHIGIP